MSLTQTLDTLLLKLTLLPAEEEQRIRERWPALDEEAQKGLIRVLEESIKRQDAMLAKIIERDPTFVDGLTKFLKDQVAAAKTQERSSDAAAIEELTEKIDA